MKYDVAIIGSGLGGLVCANILSRLGKRVIVLEQGAQPGGCLQSYKRGKTTFDTGFHCVGGLAEGQSLHTVFSALGLLSLPWQRLDPNGMARVTIDDRTFVFEEGYDNFARRLADYFPNERTALQRFAELLKQSAHTQLDALNPKAAPSDFAMHTMEINAWDYLNSTFTDPLLISVISGTSLKTELRKASLPLFTFLHTVGGFVESSWRLKGDGSLIVNSLVDSLRRYGGDVVTNTKVTELVEHEGQITQAVCANGERYDAQLFVSDIHPLETCRLVKANDVMRMSYRNRISRLPNTYGMFTVSVRLKPRFLKYFNYNHYIYSRADVWTIAENNTPVSGLMISCRVPNDGEEYAQQLDLLTPMTWDNCIRWQNTTVGRRGVTYKKMKQRMANDCMMLADNIIPGLFTAAQVTTSTPLTWRDYTGTPYGSAYGLRKDSANALGTMLSPRTPLPNLFLTGQSLMLHGLHGVTMTALHTCAEIVGKSAVGSLLIINYSLNENCFSNWRKPRHRTSRMP